MNQSIHADLASIFETNNNKEEKTKITDDNPFSTDRFIDQKLDAPSRVVIKSPSSSIFPIDSKININNLINNFNGLNNSSTNLTPASKNTNPILNPTTTTSKTIIPSTEKPTYQQIIDEFDPINNAGNGFDDKKPVMTPLVQNNFVNLTPRPFNNNNNNNNNNQMGTGSVNAELKFQNRQSISPQKPNYNVNLPLVNSSQMFRHPQINYNNNFTLPSSQSFVNAGTMSSPYYASSFSAKPQTFRPVNFTAPINTNINKFAPRSNSTDFSKLPNSQPPQ